MQDRYQLWVHRGDGRVYAVRLTHGFHQCHQRITGVAGPLDPLSPISAEMLAHCCYREDEEALQDVVAGREEFQVLLPRGRERRRKPRVR